MLQKHELILEFFNNIDKIIDIHEKFLNLTMKSKLFRINQMYNEEKKEGIQSQKKRIKKDKRNKIFVDYDASMAEFKSSLFKVIADLFEETNDIDILILL